MPEAESLERLLMSLMNAVLALYGAGEPIGDTSMTQIMEQLDQLAEDRRRRDLTDIA